MAVAPRKLGLTRDQFASFLQDFEQIKQFENLFAAVDTIANVELNDINIAAGNANAAANEANDSIQRLLDALDRQPSDLSPELMAAINELRQELQTMPRNELGTMAPLQQDNIPWLQFNTAPQGYPTGPAANGTVYWDDADAIKTLNIVMEDSGAVIQHIGEETYYRVKASSAITEGQVVMFTGTVGASGGLRGAPATGLTAFQNELIMGVATQNIANNGWGYVTWFGEVKGINTTGGAEAWVDGQVLYYNPAVAGGLTKNVPVAPNPKVIVASVVHAATNGILFIRPSFGSALGSTDSNVEITGLANGDLLQYDGVQARWENVPASSASIGTATNLAGGAANRIAYQTAPNTTGFIVAPTSANTYLEWSGSAFQWSSNPLGTVTSVSGAGTVNGLTLTGTVTSSGSLTLGGTLSGIGNSALTNSSITINGSAISLGGSVSVGTVTSASVVTANGFAGTVANATTTPAITLTTSVTGMVKGNGTALSAATKDVDYIAPAPPLTKAADFTVGAGENWFINNKSGSTCTVTLPAASSYAGRSITFQNYQNQFLVSASSNVVPRAGGSAGTAILDDVAGNWATLVSDGTNWVIMQAAPYNVMLI